MGLSKILRNTVIGAAGLAGYVSSGEKANATTYVIDRTWTNQEVKNLVDGNPETFGKGNTNAQPFDIAHFSVSRDLDFEQDPAITVGVPDLILEGENMMDTVINGGIDKSDGAVFVFKAPGFLVRDITLNNALVGSAVKGYVNGRDMTGAFSNVYFSVPYPIAIDNYPDRDSQRGPNILVSNCVMQEPEIGTHENEAYGEMTLNTRSFAYQDCTLIDVLILGGDVPSVCKDGSSDCPCDQKESLEWGHFDRNSFSGKGGGSFSETFFCSNGGGSPIGEDTPDFNVEYNVGDTLAAHGRGTGNLAVDPKITYWAYPRKGSPLIENDVVTRGAVKQKYGDGNNDGKVNLRDYADFSNKFGQGEETLPLSQIVVYDVNGDRYIDLEDYLEMSAYFLPNK